MSDVLSRENDVITSTKIAHRLMHRANQNKDRKLEMLSAAGLIEKFTKGFPVGEVYRRGILCYEVLLDLIETPEVAKDISEFAKLPPEKIKSTALKIVNLFLFNKENDPFLSLGLSHDAIESKIKKRWKRLLMIYHPDRLSHQTGYEEMAKKINQSYREIVEQQGKSTYYDPGTRKQWDYTPVKTHFMGISTRILHNRYLKHLPTFILVTTIFVAIFTIAVFIIRRI